MRWSLLLFLLFSGGVILFSCKKPTLGENGTIPNNTLGVIFTDTLTVRAYNVREDSLEGDNQAINILGTMNDPLFGNSYASIYSQFALPIDNLILSSCSPSCIVVDSTILCLTYAGSYGDIRTPMNIRVYRMYQVLSVDSIYFTDRTFNLIPLPPFPQLPALVGSLSNYVPNLADSIYLDPNKLDYDSLGHAPEMRIKLSNSLGQDIVNQAGGANVVDNPTFQNYFNGLYITPDTTKPGKGMVYLNMGAADSHLSIYFRDTAQNGGTTNKAIDTVVYFYSNSLAKIVEHFQHNYKGAPAAKLLNTNNPNGDSLLYLQSMASIKAKVYVPYLHNLVQQVGGIAINKAELVFTAVSDSSTFPNPLEITINTLDSVGMDTALADQGIGTGYFGGFKTSAITRYNTNTQYGVNLSLYYQGIAEGGIDSGLYVFPFPPARISDRVVFGGSGGGAHSPYNNSKYRVRLNLTYTKIKQ